MANVKITELDFASTPLAGSELIEIVQGGVNKKVEVNEVGGGGGVTEFIELTDVPASYTGQGSKVVAVKVDETGLEFVSGGGSQDLQDTLDNGKTATFTGVGGEDISINMGGDDGSGEAVDLLIMNKTVVDDTYSTQRFQKVNILSYSSTIENSVTGEAKVSVIGLSDGEFSIEKQNSHNLGAKISSQFLELEDIAEVDISGTNLDVIFKPKPKFVSGTYYLVDEDYVTNAIAGVTTPDATPTVKGIAKLYTSLGSNTDGAVDQNTVNSALQGFIPLSGTTVGNPVTGDIEINDTKKIFTETESGYFDIITDIDNNLETTINVRNSENTTRSSLLLSGGGDSSLQSISTYNSSLVSSQDGVKLFSNNPNYKGIQGENDYSSTEPTNLNIYAQRQYVANAIAGVTTPDATPTVKGIAKLYTSLGSNTDGAVDQNTVNSALALKANLQNVEQIIRSKSNGTFGSHTGDTAETVIAVIDIDANEFEAGDWMTLLFSCEKDATVGNITWRLRAGVNGNTSDGQIAILNATSANSRYSALYRGRPQFLTGNQLRIWGTLSSVTTDISNSGAPSLVSLTPTSAWKLTVTAQLTVSTETASLTGYRIGKIKSF